MKTLHLDELEATPIGNTLWKPIRSTLGIEAFGINAYVGEEAGDTLFDEHDETEPGAGRQRHEEVYVVLSGRATFVVGGREFSAPAGTLVFCDDPAERRGARAEDRGTTVLAIGGPAGEKYEIPPWEYRFRVRRARLQGNVEEAREMAKEARARYPSELSSLEAEELEASGWAR